VFDCKTVNETELEELIQTMRSDKDAWLKSVRGHRQCLYNLNYFTCLQLLNLSGEFYLMIKDSEYQIGKDNFLLLLGISPELTIETIKQVTKGKQSFILEHNPVVSFILADKEEEEVATIEKNLSKEEKDAYENAKAFKFNNLFALEAILQNKSNLDDVVNWCYENESKFDIFIREKPKKTSKPKAQEIDSNNSTVQQLLILKYPKSIAINAVEECGEDIAKCINYCNSQLLTKDTTTLSEGTESKSAENPQLLM